MGRLQAGQLPHTPSLPATNPVGRSQAGQLGTLPLQPHLSQALPWWAGRRLGSCPIPSLPVAPLEGRLWLGSLGPPPSFSRPLHGQGAGLTRTMWPVEMSMFGCTGSSDQDEVLLRAEGLGAGPSLNWEDTLLTRDVCVASGRSAVRTARRCRHSSCKTAGARRGHQAWPAGSLSDSRRK